MSNIVKAISKADDMDLVLELNGITKTFRDSAKALTILKGGNLVVHRGEIVALQGPSGCGKSTLLQIAGLLDNPTSGTILIGGNSVNNMSEAEQTKIRLKKLGFIYQRYNLLGDFTALENVEMPMLIAGAKKSDASVRAQKLLRVVGLGNRINHKPSALSGGEQQRVALARALANNPEIILADEPTGNLDPANAEIVFDLILDLARRTKMSMLIVTHDNNIAEKCDRIYTIKDGIVG